ncbi:nucleotidyltransferase family protein [Sphingobacterium sp. PCS056]|uniref:nucleotidyltransferase family protein n=1 Tax=Sphingobacterium sp. PCS056 TaxID=2931400 RepID=UPI00200F5080|nr:nucleotidyltransferase family protein [Sphingobacterium sp. PCS056]UPZ37856.1 nucleotidyltransferase family protein [Sphingobacterium sp. PCS056]
MKESLRAIFFQLIRIGLWGKGTLTRSQSLSEADWIQIRDCAINHTVEGLIYDSFAYLDEQHLPPKALLMKWAVRMDQIERHNKQMNQVIAAQYLSFTKQGLKPILQKGKGVAACYEIPSHRISGDIDWYFQEGGYAKARQMLKDKNLAFKDTAGFSLDYDWKGIHIEHHKKLFDLGSPLKYNYLKKLQKKYKSKQTELVIHDVSITLLAPELQLLQVNAHILKHLISFGIGLRQLCDSARLYYTVASQIDPDTLKKIYQGAGILGWTHLLHIILVKNLGLPKDKVPFPYPEGWNADWMMDEIWYSGNFGFHDERFKSGKISPFSIRPDSTRRILRSLKTYFKYAPQEILFFPIMRTYSRLFGIDKN